jgi:hypothetical protein
VRPPNKTPEGAGRAGAFNAAKIKAGVPTSMQPSRTLPNVNKEGKPQPGRIYEFDIKKNGADHTVRIREDSAGHTYPDGPEQNRGPHFNSPDGTHFDY